MHAVTNRTNIIQDIGDVILKTVAINGMHININPGSNHAKSQRMRA